MRLPLLLTLCALLPLPAMADTIYRTVDANGRPSFSDKSSGTTGEQVLEKRPVVRPFSQLPDAVFEPVFQTTLGRLAAGKVFVATLPDCGEAVLVSALHLFGPAGGLPAQMRPQEVETRVTRIELRSLKSGNVAAEAPLVSVTPVSASPFGSRPMGAGDVAAFLAPAKVASLALAVAGATPAKGEKVFVLTSVAGNRKKLAHAAVVAGHENGYLAYDFTERDFVLQATSGAPVVNEHGQVVAINVAGGQDGAGLHGLGTPVEK